MRIKFTAIHKSDRDEETFITTQLPETYKLPIPLKALVEERSTPDYIFRLLQVEGQFAFDIDWYYEAFKMEVIF